MIGKVNDYVTAPEVMALELPCLLCVPYVHIRNAYEHPTAT
jgi:hypothetical protein